MKRNGSLATRAPCTGTYSSVLITGRSESKGRREQERITWKLVHRLIRFEFARTQLHAQRISGLRAQHVPRGERERKREFQKMASNCVHSFRGRDRPRLRTRLRTLPGESPLLSTSQWAGESLVIVDKNDPDSTVNLESLQSLLSTGRMVEKLFGFCKFL